MAGEYNRFVARTREDLGRLEGEVQVSEEEMRAYQEGNLREWQRAYKMADAKGKAVLDEQMRAGKESGEFPADAEAGFKPVQIEQGVKPQGFQPVEISPRFSENIGPKVREEMATRDAAVGPGGDVPTIGFQDTPGGAAVSRVQPRLRGDEVQDPGVMERVLLETVGASAGAMAGGAIGGLSRNPTVGALGMRAGEAGGAFLGSLLSEAFDPTEKPLETATIAGGFTLGTGLASSGGAALFRRMLGKPTEAGKYILQVMEREGKVPPPGVVLPETSVAQTMQSIGSAEAFFGRSVREHLQDTSQVITKDLRHYLADFYRYKRGADTLFKEWDDTVASLMNNKAFGNPRRVNVRVEHFEALESAVKEWERQGLTHMVDNSLLKIVDWVQQIKNTPGVTLKSVPLTMSEAEAARTFIYNRARAIAGGAADEKSVIGGKDFARAYREIAEEIGTSMDKAIDDAVKTNVIPANAKAKLLGARSLWKQWKQGEAMLDELTIPLKAAKRSDLPLRGQAIKTAIASIERQEARIGRPIISTTQKAHLAGIERALRAVEQSGKTGAFNLAVRTGQMASLTVGVTAGAMTGGLAGVGGAVTMALSPAAFTFLMTNPKAARLLITGLRLEPGTAQAARAGRELLTLMAKEGHVDLGRTGMGEEPEVEE